MSAGGSYVHIPPVEHKCPLPKCDDPIGTIWRCDTCQTYWRRIEEYVGFGCSRTWTTDFWRNIKSGNLSGWCNASGSGAK